MCVYVCVCVSMSLCMCVFMCICVCVYVYVCMVVYDLSARYRKMEDLLGGGEPPGLAARQLEEEVAEQDVESGGHAARDTEP